MKKSTYTDAQICWLFDKFQEGYTYPELCAAVFMSKGNLRHHFLRLGLMKNREDLPPLDLTPFYKLGREPK